jgi:HEAT repeat protein
MQFSVWSCALATAGCAQHELPAPGPQHPAAGTVIDDSELCLDVHAWWPQNAERFLHNGTRRIPPSDAILDQRIAPALRKALDKVAKSDASGDADRSTDDLVSACLIALARIGREAPEAPLANDFVRHLRHPNQEVRESAALALGIAGIDGPHERDLLVQLVRGDTALGPVAGEGPSLRTRTFATYGLGLLANRSTRLATQRTVLQTAQWALRQEPREVDLQVAAVHALSLLNLPANDKAAEVLRTQTLEVLADTMARNAEPGDLVACACPTL